MPADRACELVKRFAGQQILVIGDVMMDRCVFGKVERLNPEAPVPILHAKRETATTGGAGNTAKNAAALRAAATLVSVVGDDKTADDVQSAAAAEGYRAVLIRDPGRPTIEKKRFIVGGQQMLRVDYEETHDIEGPVETRLTGAIAAEAGNTDAIIVSDYAKGVLTPAVAQAIMTASQRHQLPVMADVKPSHIHYFTGATFISPNRKEAHEYLGLNQHLQGGHGREDLAARLHATFRTNVFLTLSEEGMFIQGGDTAGVHVPQIHRIEVADTSGCGDTAAVAIVLAKLSGATDIEAAQIGNAAGAIIAGRIGAVALTQNELLEALAHT
jgi:D-beta-D-heptose 7-phosphate kinase/D-beta-D-heptose 1-phosphate adenosyltransferase